MTNLNRALARKENTPYKAVAADIVARLPFIFMDRTDVLAVTPFESNATLCRKIAAGEFPAPDVIGKRSYWRSDRIAQWLTGQVEKTDAEREALTKKSKEKTRRARARRHADPALPATA
jgi:predicted DNA-binding transcriptional regulator AlpA